MSRQTPKAGILSHIRDMPWAGLNLSRPESIIIFPGNGKSGCRVIEVPGIGKINLFNRNPDW
jgi:hypothetical protein